MFAALCDTCSTACPRTRWLVSQISTPGDEGLEPILRRRLAGRRTRKTFTLRAVLLVPLLLSLGPLRLAAQITVSPAEFSSGLKSGSVHQVDAFGWTGLPVRFDLVAVQEKDTEQSLLPAVPSFEACIGAASDGWNVTAARWRARVGARKGRGLKLSIRLTDSAFLIVQERGPQKRSWIARHPVLVGTVVGFGGGFIIGYLGGDDGVFDDFTASFNGVLVGGIGAGVGAAVGGLVGAATR